MRVIGGKHRSRKLEEVFSENTRETRDRVKETIFNSINQDLYDANILDLFAGSGSLGIEGLSRGANSAVFVDIMPKAVEVIKNNIKMLHLESSSEIYFGNFEDFLTKTYKKFDVILLDPPYKMDVIDDIVKQIARKKLLSSTGVIISLYSKNNSLNKDNNGIIEYKQKTIGITKVSYMKWGI